MDADQLVVATANLTQTATEDVVATQMLRVLGEEASRALPVGGTGVMIRRNDDNEFVHVARPLAEAVPPLERLQQTLKAGPCADAMDSRVTVTSTDMSGDLTVAYDGRLWHHRVEATGAPVIRTDARTLRCGYVSTRVQAVTGWSVQTWQSPEARELTWTSS